jgi:hypothetical protein
MRHDDDVRTTQAAGLEQPALAVGLDVTGQKQGSARGHDAQHARAIVVLHGCDAAVVEPLERDTVPRPAQRISTALRCAPAVQRSAARNARTYRQRREQRPCAAGVV